jgi:hypothetical protein
MADEKFDEKEMEKREEKSPEEKSWDEKWRRDPLSAVVWAAIFIWAGLVLLASNLGYLDQIIRRTDIPGLEALPKAVEAWPLILTGAGVIILLEVVVRLLVPAFRKSVIGSLIFAIILIGIGLGDLISWNIFWPTILIVLGISILLRGLGRKE